MNLKEAEQLFRNAGKPFPGCGATKAYEQKSNCMVYNIEPCPKPRMTRSDKWNKRPRVMRYRDFCNQVQAAGIKVPESGATITFVLPMPKTWSKKKKAEMLGQPHQTTPDLDNLLKALLDAIYDNDSGVWNVMRLEKRWGLTGQIIIRMESELQEPEQGLQMPRPEPINHGRVAVRAIVTKT